MTIELATYILWSFMLIFVFWLTTVVAKDVNYKEGYREGYEDGISLKTTSLLQGVNSKTHEE